MRPLAESERIGELIATMDRIDTLLDQYQDVEIRCVLYNLQRNIVKDSTEIKSLDFDDVRIIRAALVAALKGDEL